MSHTPSTDSVYARLAAFFVDQPDEELSIADIPVKFGCSSWTAHDAVRRLCAERKLESVRIVRCRTKGIAR